MSADRNRIMLSVPGKSGRMLQPGDIVGDNYELLTFLGEGGMGVVFLCWHKIIDREYALKILKPEQVNEQSWQRFQVEGRAIAKLDHPNIIKIFNMGIEANDCPYYVMELLKGPSLEETIHDGIVGQLEEVLDLFKQLTDGFAYAHSKGVIHRDIKPDNIVLEPTDSGQITIKIVDFGIAKLVKQDSLMKQGLTSAGDVFGTPLYMSPEQSMGRELDHRSDIYSLGCTFFKTLTGKFPFLGQTAVETVIMHQTTEAPSLSASSNKTFPKALEEIVHKMLEKNPDDRYQSMEEVGRDIDSLRQNMTGVEKTNNQKDNQTRSLATDPDQHTTGPTKQNTTGRLKQKHLATSLWAVVAVTALMLIGVGAIAYSIFGKSNNQQQPRAATINDAPQTAVTRSSDLQSEKIDRSFAAFKWKKATFSLVDGKSFITLYFPDMEIGEIVSGDGLSSPAKGALKLKVLRPLALKIRRGSNRQIWENAELLKKIDLNEIDTLNLSGEDSLLIEAAHDDKDMEAKQVIKMLSVASNWTNFKSVEFAEFFVSKEIFSAVNKLPMVTMLAATKSSNSGADLAQFSILRRLEKLNIADMKDIDAVLNKLVDSKNLISLDISDTTPSPQALRHLESCPRLKQLTFGASKISDEQMSAIGAITSLENLNLKGSHFKAGTLADQKGLTALKTIVVSSAGWTKAEVEHLQKSHPHCLIDDSDFSSMHNHVR